MNSEERDSQLSAMFDDELPAEQCELIARRLARDEVLKTRWGRYATIGAAIRAERGLKLQSPLAQRVASAVLSEPPLGATPAVAKSRSFSLLRIGQPVAGAAIAASVAVCAVLWMREHAPAATLLAQVTPTVVRPAPLPASTALINTARRLSPDSYTVPPASARAAVVPPAQLANYVVAHSQYSMPWLRGNALSSLVGGGSAEASQAPLQNPADAPRIRDAAQAR